MDELKKWIYTIVVVIVFVTFIEMLMPNSSIKKYTRLILGLIVMTIVLQPLFSFIKKDFSLSGDSFKFQKQLDSVYIKKQASDIDAKQSSEITKQYIENLKKQVIQLAKRELGDREVKAVIEIIDDIKSDNYGEIVRVSLIIGKNLKTVDNIEKVKIGDSKEPKSKESNENYQVLKNKICAMYSISKDKIQINTEN